jgi:hypothetical protein
MAPCDVGGTRELLEAVIAAFAVLGGVIAYTSGYFAAEALTANQPPEIVAHRINEGIGRGFIWGSLPATVALIIAVWN